MAEVMDGFYYTKTHEWVKKEDDDTARIGLTDYAQHQLTDIAYVELPEVGEDYPKGEPLGVVESVKSSDEIMSPISGEVLEANTDLEDSPELINQSPYKDGWLVVMTVSDADDFDELMDSETYKKYLETQ
jgi:glycine cleavage system H protein